MRTVLAIGVIFGIQILFFLINRRELARSEFYIYILFASLALTGGWAHVVGVSIFKKQSLHLTIINSLRAIGVGATGGLAFGVTCILIFAVSENIQIYDNAIDKAILIKSGVLSIFSAIFEEFIYRGILLRASIRVAYWVECRGNFIPNVIQAFVFCIMHSGTPQFQGGFYPSFVFVMGFLLGCMAINGKSLWLPIGFHFSWNFINCISFGIHLRVLTSESGLFPGYINGLKFTLISLTLSVCFLFIFLLARNLRELKHEEIGSL